MRQEAGAFFVEDVAVLVTVQLMVHEAKHTLAGDRNHRQAACCCCCCWRANGLASRSPNTRVGVCFRPVWHCAFYIWCFHNLQRQTAWGVLVGAWISMGQLPLSLSESADRENSVVRRRPEVEIIFVFKQLATAQQQMKINLLHFLSQIPSFYQ